MEIVYVLHFINPDGSPYRQHSTPNHFASHYVGFCYKGLDSRLRYHRRGQGSRLLRAVIQGGGDFVVALAVPGDRNVERRIKTNGHLAYSACPICRGDARLYRREDKFYVKFLPKRKDLWYLIGRNGARRQAWRDSTRRALRSRQMASRGLPRTPARVPLRQAS